MRIRKPSEQPPGLREQVAELRAGAAAARDEIEAQQRAVDDRRAKDEAGELEAEAEELELKQDRLDRADELRAQAEAVEASADELDRHAERLNGEMLEAAMRANRFERQIATDVTGRRQELEQRSTAAAEAGDTDAVMEAERDLALLPTLEAKLKEQADTADAQATELNQEAAEVESRADNSRANAIALRRWADLDPLSLGAPPLPELEQKARERARLDPGARLAAREAAFRAVRTMPDSGDPEAAAEVFALELNAYEAARVQALHAEDVAQLEQVTRLVEEVRDEAAAEAQRRRYAPIDVQFTALIARAERQNLEEALTAYRVRLGRELPLCHELATNEAFGLIEGRLYPDRFATDVSEAAAAAVEELAAERAALA